jgi:hypothetical protein
MLNGECGSFASFICDSDFVIRAFLLPILPACAGIGRWAGVQLSEAALEVPVHGEGEEFGEQNDARSHL